MGSKSVEETSCVWCIAANRLENKIAALKSVVCKISVWYAAAAFAVLFLLIAVWVVLLADI
jgi:hypothetical protein